MSKGIVYSWITYFAFLLFTAVNYLIFNLLSLEPRRWLTVLIWFMITITPFLLIFFMLLKTIRISRNNTAKGLLIFVLVIYSVISMGVLFLLGLRGLFNLEEEKILEDGSILVTEASFPDPGPSYRCLQVMFFARQLIPGTQEIPEIQAASSSESSTKSDAAINNLLRENDPAENNLNESNSDESTSNESTSDESNPNESNSNESNPSDILSDSPGIDEPTKAAQIIYDKIFAPQGKKCNFQYNAKGNLYVILGRGTRELDGTTVNTQETLTYDRVSQNGKCHLFVYYEEHYDADGNKLDNTSILNFYAVNLETAEVTAADKTSWSDSGSAAYHEATDEY